MCRAVALETSRGWRIAKEKQSHKIDVVVALAQAALGAVQLGQIRFGPVEYTPAPKFYGRLAGLFQSTGSSGRDTAEAAEVAEDGAVSLRGASRWLRGL